MPEREYVCAYKHCLHHGQKIKASEAVVLHNRHYHADCAEMRDRIQSMAKTFVESADIPEQYPVVMRVLNTIIFKNEVPVDFVKAMLEQNRIYYAEKGAISLYGIRKLFWEKEFTA